jgi:hypothetical protein
MNFWFPQNAENFLTSWKSASLSEGLCSMEIVSPLLGKRKYPLAPLMTSRQLEVGCVAYCNIIWGDLLLLLWGWQRYCSRCHIRSLSRMSLNFLHQSYDGGAISFNFVGSYKTEWWLTLQDAWQLFCSKCSPHIYNLTKLECSVACMGVHICLLVTTSSRDT